MSAASPMQPSAPFRARSDSRWSALFPASRNSSQRSSHTTRCPRRPPSAKRSGRTLIPQAGRRCRVAAGARRRRSRLAGPPRIAIVIDDLGADVVHTRRAIALPQAVALAFLPYPRITPTLAREAGRAGHEVLVHVPMQAVGAQNPGPMALQPDRSHRRKTSAGSIGRSRGCRASSASTITKAACSPRTAPRSCR